VNDGPEPERRGRAEARLGLVALGSVLLLSAAACLRRIWASDFWWQYKTGEYVAQQGIPAFDVFSYTVPGSPWIELRWLYCLAQYGLMEAFGPAALVLLKWVAIVVTFYLLSRRWLRGATLAPAALVLTIALLASSQRFFVRPELVSYVFIAVFVSVLDRHRRSASRWIWVLPALQVLWVNSHTLSIYGSLLVGALLVAMLVEIPLGRRSPTDTRPLLVVGGVLLATALAGLVNPWGLDGLRFPFQLFSEIRGTVFKETITELSGPFVFGFGFTAVRYYVVLIALAALSLAVNRRRVDPFWLILFVSQLYLSLLAIRNLPLFCLVAVPFVLSNIDRRVTAAGPRVAIPLQRLTAGLAIALSLWYSAQMFSDRFHVRQGDTNQAGLGLARHRFPRGAVEFLDRNDLTGRVFSPMLEATYLLAHDRPVFVDPRIEVYGEELFERFVNVLRVDGAWAAAVAEYDLRVLVVNLQARLARVARDDPDWLLVYFDDVSAVFVRRGSASGPDPIDTPIEFDRSVEQLRAALPAPRPYTAFPVGRVSPPFPYLALADFLLMFGQVERAAEMLDAATTAYPRLPGMALRRATLAELERDWSAVIAHATDGLRERPDDPRLEIKLGAAHFQLREHEQARVWLERSLVGLPARARTWGMLGSIHAHEGDLDEALRCYERAVALEPEAADTVTGLARIQARRGRTEEAITGLSRALELAPAEIAVRRDLVLLYATTGDAAAARRELARGLELDPDDPTLRALAQRLGVSAP
jgi:Flp pilus assembly protein TadD